MTLIRKKISLLPPAELSELTDNSEVVVLISGEAKLATLGMLRSFIGLSAQSYTHVQATPAMSWSVVHQLGSAPGGVNVIDSDGNNVLGIITHVNENLTTIEFSEPVSGEAVVS